MIFIFFFLSSIVFCAEQENIFRSTIELFKKNNTGKNSSIDLAEYAKELDANVLQFYARHSITSFQEHHDQINKLLRSYLKDSRPGSFNSLLYHNGLFLKQIDNAGAQEWAMLSKEEKMIFTTQILKEFDSLDKRTNIHSLAVNTYILSLAKPSL